MNYVCAKAIDRVLQRKLKTDNKDRNDDDNDNDNASVTVVSARNRYVRHSW